MPSEDGLLGTLGTRLKVAITSSAVNSAPSCHLTPFLSLNSQVVSSSARQLSARPGFRFCCSSCLTRESKKCFDIPLLGVRLWKCGSSEVIGADSAMDSSCAAACSGRKAPKNIKKRKKRLTAGSGERGIRKDTWNKIGACPLD